MSSDLPHRFCGECPFSGRTESDHCPECGAPFFPSAPGAQA